MANLPEKNIVTVGKVTSIPSNTNVFINANGEFVQASINDVVKASNVVSDATLNAVKEAIDNQFNVYSGKSILATTSGGYATDFTAYGASEQKQYSGKNEYNVGNLTALTDNGITFTPYYDNDEKLLYVNVNGTSTEQATYQMASKQLSVGEFIMNGTPNGGSTSTYFMFTQNASFGSDIGNGVALTTNTVTDIRPTIIVRKGVTVNNLKFYPMIRKASITDDTYEPYVGGVASPNPDYPQEIVSVGDKGYFDGELLNGVYSTSNGIYGTNVNYLCNKNPMPCKANDEVTFAYHSDTQYNLMILFYDKDMNYLSYKNTTTSDSLTAIAPTNACYCNFNIGYGSALSIASASPITVTINGMYALIVKNGNKNLWEFGSSQSFTYRLDENVYLPKGTYTFSALVTSADTDSNISRVFFFDKDNTTVKYGDLTRNGRASFTVALDREVTRIRLYAASYDAISINDTATFADIQLELGDTMTDFVEHEEQTTYIPLTEPLRSVGEVKDSVVKVDGLYGEGRKLAKLVLDGSADESINVESVGDESTLFKITVSGAKTSVGFCNRLTTSMSVEERYSIVTNEIYFRLLNSRLSSLDVAGVKAWLTSNNLEFIYELAEETFTPFTDQTPFYSMKTFDGVTLISSDAEMDVEVPTSRAGGVASIGYAKGNLAEIEMQNIKTKLTELQTAVVSA